MQDNKNPATPANAATPGTAPQNGNAPANPSSAPNGDQGKKDEGKVTISLEEYRNLQRQNARAKSLERRNNISNSQRGQAEIPEGADPELVQKYNQAETARKDAERRALQLEVKERVRDLLENEEFKSLPSSTKSLILRNPAIASDANDLETALLDIEDFLRDEVIKIDMPKGNQNNQPAGHETPTVVTNNNPAPVSTSEPEDLSKLRGPARSTAAIRNLLKNPNSKN